MLAQFTKKKLASYDASHDYNHSLRVYHNACLIMRLLITESSIGFTEEEQEIIMYSCVTHDILDHKYQNSCSTEELHRFITGQIGERTAGICIKIINNISWSKQQAGRNRPLENGDLLRQIVQCADWIDAMGKVGIERCTTYTMARGGSVPADVIAHAHEKLVKIYDQLPLREARMIAEDAHNEIVEWLAGY